MIDKELYERAQTALQGAINRLAAASDRMKSKDTRSAINNIDLAIYRAKDARVFLTRVSEDQ